VPVVDASVLVEYVIDGIHGHAAREALGAGEELWAPYLVDAEVGHAIRGHVRSGQLQPETASAALDEFADLRVRRMAHRPFLARAFELRDNLSFYDALYVALAEELEMRLVTFDRRLALAPGLRTTVELLA
jgi:predicted nucleic acid-binding protein